MSKYLIVGGTTGIGEELAKILDGKGHQVIVTGRGANASPVGTFINWDASSDSPLNIQSEQLDGVVYCPGTIALKPFHRFTDEEILQDFKINALGAARILRETFPLLKKSSSPAVVLFSTVAVQTGMAFHSSIGMAKGAIEGLTRSLAAEWAPTVRVNAIAPSLTNTPLAEKLLSTPEKIEAGNKRHPLARVGSPRDLAAMAAFLLSEDASWITGQILHVDGGIGNLKAM
jgi:NAD(P)-dependent dehydrogenase (short-subunit alcohol dehydrogenase family)